MSMKFLVFKLPVILCGDPNNKEAIDKEVQLTVNNPMDIECYHPTYMEDNYSMIVMRSGLTFITNMSCAQLDKHMAGYYAQLEKMAQEARSGLIFPSQQ